MIIVATLGSESHTTSRGWSKLALNGKTVTWRDAVSTEWLTKYGDKHARWCECIFKVEPGDKVTWEAGSNSGSRGSNRKRENLELVVDPDAPEFDNEGVGYPADNAKINGRLRLVEDTNKAQADRHQALKNQV